MTLTGPKPSLGDGSPLPDDAVGTSVWRGESILLKRRHLLGGTLLAVLSTQFAGGLTAHANNGKDRLVQVSLVGTEQWAFDVVENVAYPYLIPQFMLAEGRADLLSEALVTLTWDPAYLSFESEDVQSGHVGRRVDLGDQVEMPADGTIQIPLPKVQGGQESILSRLRLPFRSNALYPNDLQPLGASATVAIRLSDGTEVTSSADTLSTAVEGYPWGGLLSAIWHGDDPLAGAGPAVVRLESVGPSPIPSGVPIVVESSSLGQEGISLRSAFLNNDESAEFPIATGRVQQPDGTVSQVITLQTELASGSHVTFVFEDDPTIALNVIDPEAKWRISLNSLNPEVFQRKTNADTAANISPSGKD